MKRILNLALIGLLLASCGSPESDERLAESGKRLAISGKQYSSMALDQPKTSKPAEGPAVRGPEWEGQQPRRVNQQTSKPAQSLPFSVHLQVPFSPQAPLAVWDALHEEACEEMSLILVHHYLEGTTITRDQAEAELQTLLRWEEEHGYQQDVTVAQLLEISERYYGHPGRVIHEPTTDDLKRLLAEGHPVIIPAAGRDLGNPYFTGAGPWYHMLVLTGYSEFFFVTNDVGTRRGEGYVYRFSTLMDAMHDWTGVKEEIRTGPKRVLIMEK